MTNSETAQIVHELKISTKDLQEIMAGRKTFDIREKDREYRVGDLLVLNDWDPEHLHSGFSATCLVTHILADSPLLADGYICMSIRNIETDDMIDDNTEEQPTIVIEIDAKQLSNYDIIQNLPSAEKPCP